MNLLNCDNVQRFVAENRDNGTQLWAFHHLPRTAGTSLTAEILQRLQPSCDIHITMEAFARDSFDPDTEIDLAFRRFWDEQKKTRFRFASGHLLHSHVQQLRTLPHVRILTMLRHPVQRVVSLYRYLQSPASPDHQKFIRKCPHLDAFIESPQLQNLIAASLGGSDAAAAQCIDILSRDYLFCAIFEHLAVSFGMIRLLLGFEPSDQIAHLNAAPRKVANEVDDVGRYRDKILAANEVDTEIYYFVQRQFQEKLQEMAACLSTYVPEHSE